MMLLCLQVLQRWRAGQGAAHARRRFISGLKSGRGTMCPSYTHELRSCSGKGTRRWGGGCGRR